MDPLLPPGYTLRTAVDHADFRSFARLAVRYHAWLNVDLQFQDFEHELASLPGSYAQPAGCILLVSYRSSADAAPEDVACVAVRPLKQQERSQGDSSCNSIAAAALQGATTHQQQQQQQQDDTPADTLSSLHTCELKRLWVKGPHQRFGLGRALMAAALQASKQMGYSSMVLDTLDRLSSANRLYQQLGFKQSPAYYTNPLPGVMFWRKDL